MLKTLMKVIIKKDGKMRMLFQDVPFASHLMQPPEKQKEQYDSIDMMRLTLIWFQCNWIA